MSRPKAVAHVAHLLAIADVHIDDAVLPNLARHRHQVASMHAAIHSQWLFTIAHLQLTPSLSTYSIQRELYDRARGVEFLFRLGTSLAMPSSALFTAATWFHRFYMRYSLEDYHRQEDVAAACIFLATKTEECGRKLRDVARVCQAKVTGLDLRDISSQSPEVRQVLNAILLTEEALLEALCFDFVVAYPHSELVDFFETQDIDHRVQEYAWSIAHDSYRTPLCILFPPSVIAASCYLLAQHVVDGPDSPSLDARILSVAPSASLPTPPTHEPASPNPFRSSISYFAFDATGLAQVSESLCILLQFYKAQDIQAHPYLPGLVAVSFPTTHPQPPFLYSSFADMHTITTEQGANAQSALERTPSSLHGGSTPAKTEEVNGRLSVKPDNIPSEARGPTSEARGPTSEAKGPT